MVAPVLAPVLAEKDINMSISFLKPSIMPRLLTGLLFVLFAQVAMADLSDFTGKYSGSADVEYTDGTSNKRDMSVEISMADDGFNVSWTSTTFKSDGRIKEKSYSIDFIPSGRPNVFSAAQKKDVFGHLVQLDPMKGEPFVWARVIDDKMTVYSLFVNDDGGYEMQQFDRTLTQGGLHLDFSRVRNGKPERSVSTLLTRE
ncbi:MAG: hypothetical protein ACI8Q6_002488 [Granulosicoccus sp.]